MIASICLLFLMQDSRLLTSFPEKFRQENHDTFQSSFKVNLIMGQNLENKDLLSWFVRKNISNKQEFLPILFCWVWLEHCFTQTRGPHCCWEELQWASLRGLHLGTLRLQQVTWGQSQCVCVLQDNGVSYGPTEARLSPGVSSCGV